MRKRSKYKPKGVRLDTMGFLKENMTTISSHTTFFTMLNLKNMSALDSLAKGTANKAEVDVVIKALNVAEAFCLLEATPAYKPEVLTAQNALKDVCMRSFELGDKFICRGEELKAIKNGYKAHAEQLERATMQSMEQALMLVYKTLKAKKAKVIA